MRICRGGFLMGDSNMFKILTAITLMATISSVAKASAYEKYPVSPFVSKVTVMRVGDVLFRYVEFFEKYPCLRLETFMDADLKQIDRKEICKFKADNEVIDIMKEQLSGVIHENFKLEKNVFSFSTDIIFARPGYRYLNCTVSISNSGKLSEPVCKRGERPPEPETKK